MSHNHSSDDRVEKLKENSSKLRLVLYLVVIFAVVEVIGGVLSNSLALLSDAGHMVVDGAAIALSLFAVHLSMKPSTSQNTYSLVRMEIVAAFINGITLIVLAGFIFYESVKRIGEPPAVEGELMFVVALIGMIVNIVSAWILWGASHDNLNVKGALLHVMGDLAGSVGAVVASIVIMTTGWTLVDPLVSLFIGLLIIKSSYGLLKESVHILLEGTPHGLSPEKVISSIEKVAGVVEVHDFHIWSLTTGQVLLTAHLKISGEGSDGTKVLCEVTEMLEKKYHLTHSTIQIEDSTHPRCQVSC